MFSKNSLLKCFLYKPLIHNRIASLFSVCWHDLNLLKQRLIKIFKKFKFYPKCVKYSTHQYSSHMGRDTTHLSGITTHLSRKFLINSLHISIFWSQSKIDGRMPFRISTVWMNGLYMYRFEIASFSLDVATKTHAMLKFCILAELAARKNNQRNVTTLKAFEWVRTTAWIAQWRWPAATKNSPSNPSIQNSKLKFAVSLPKGYYNAIAPRFPVYSYFGNTIQFVVFLRP